MARPENALVVIGSDDAGRSRGPLG